MAEPARPSEDQPKNKNTRLSKEEMAVYSKCDKEAMLKTALPMFAVFSGVGYGAMMYGYWKIKPGGSRFSRIAFLGFIGYAIGKLSCLQKCTDRVLKEVPDGVFARKLRHAQFGASLNKPPPSPQNVGPSTYGVDDSATLYMNDLRQDEMNQNVGPSTIAENDTALSPPDPSYDTLRSRNRNHPRPAGFAELQTQLDAPPLSENDEHQELGLVDSSLPSSADEQNMKRNKYGDII